MLTFFRRFALPVLILAAGVAGLFWLSSRKTPPVRQPPSVRPPLVDISVVRVQSEPFTVHTGGTVMPYRLVTLSAEVDGRIIEKPPGVRAGLFVEEGSPLLGIDPEPHRIEIERLASQSRQLAINRRRLRLELEQTEKLVELASEQVRLAEREVKRFESLATQNASSQAEQDEAQRTLLETEKSLTALLNRQAQLPIEISAAGAGLTSLNSDRLLAELKLARTKIAAPVSGIVSATHVETGSYVQAGDSLVTLQDTSRFEVECRLRGDDLFWLRSEGSADGKPGSPFELPVTTATVTYREGGREHSWQGQLRRTDGQGFDSSTRTISCRVTVLDPIREAATDGPPALMRGMYVEVAFETPARESLLAIPRAALQPNGQVWVVSSDVLRIHEVQPARVDDDIVLLHADQTSLQTGDQIIVSPLPAVVDGMKVRLRTIP